ncbi:MAG: hypothetical protein ACMUHM_00440 [Thermoplasmatota archaeon]
MSRRGTYLAVLLLVLIALCTGSASSITYFSEIEDERDDVRYFSIIDEEFYRKGGKSEIDIIRVRSEQNGSMIVLSMTVDGTIDTSGTSTYFINVRTSDEIDYLLDEDTSFRYNGTASAVFFYQNMTSVDVMNNTIIRGNTLEFSLSQEFFKDSVIFELSGMTMQWDVEDLETYMDTTDDLPFEDIRRNSDYYWIYYLVVCLVVIFAIVGFIINWKFKRLWKRNKARFCLICGGLMQEGDIDCRFCGHRYKPIRK